MIIKNATVLADDYSFIKKDLVINQSIITDIETDASENNQPVLDMENKLVVPGLIDIHTHGIGGYDFTIDTKNSIKELSLMYAKNGVTSFMPANVALPIDTLAKIYSEAAESAKNVKGAKIVGINMEGPYFSPKRLGAHSIDLLSKPKIEDIERLYEASKGLLRLICVAPDLPGSIEFISILKDRFVLSLAHTDADYDTACAAISAGARHATHLYNAMSPFKHREPGVVGCVLDSGEHVTAEIIAEPNHLHPAAIRLAFRVLGENRVVLVSDSIMASCMPDGKYQLGGLEVEVIDGSARLKDGTVAGSTAPLIQDVRYAVECGIPLETAIRAATINPARVAGIDSYTGSITKGKKADLLVLNPDLSVHMVIVEGEIKFTAGNQQ